MLHFPPKKRLFSIFATKNPLQSIKQCFMFLYLNNNFCQKLSSRLHVAAKQILHEKCVHYYYVNVAIHFILLQSIKLNETNNPLQATKYFFIPSIYFFINKRFTSFLRPVKNLHIRFIKCMNAVQRERMCNKKIGKALKMCWLGWRVCIGKIEEASRSEFKVRS